MIKKVISSILLISLCFPWIAQAASYNLNNVLTDSELLDYDSMSLARIQGFLNSKGSALANYATESVGGGSKTAGEIIFDAAQYYFLNPKYFLVRVQVEQSLITDSSPTHQQLDRATGYGCPDYSSCDPEYKGFFNQIHQSAKAIQGDNYLKGIEEKGKTISGWGPGITKTTLDGIAINPENAATAVLYTYTPWVGKYGGGDQSFGGTSLFAKLWRDWFTRHYPDGTLIQEDGTSGVYLIQNGKKKPFRNRTTFLANYDPGKIIIVSPNELDAYEDGPEIQFPNNVLLQSPKGTVYIVINGERRGIESKEIFQYLGFNPEEIIPTTWSELNSIPEGESVSAAAVFPTGTLLQSRQTGGISYVENGIRHSIWSKEIMQSRFKNRVFSVVDQKEIDLYPEREPIKFKEGELVTSNNTGIVYVISNGNKRPFGSADVFNALGYKWENIIYTTPQALEIHPTRAPISLK